MNCFVIMPFATEFDDVYAIIKNTVENTSKGIRCFRLDETRPAGRITDRLLGELQAATFCIADLSGCRPNVMWEVGYAMALDKPIILVTQSLKELPFDLKDMHSIEYMRTRLSSSLGDPLRRTIIDTLAAISSNNQVVKAGGTNNSDVVGTLLKEVEQLKEIVLEVVNAWKNGGAVASQPASELQSMTGHWLNKSTKTNLYMRVIHGELVAPYCYSGNDGLTAVYFGWRRTGDYWFARYQWLEAPISGFAFLRQQSDDTLSGAWWSGEYEEKNGDMPPRGSGMPVTLRKQKSVKTPEWAETFFQSVERDGLAKYLAKIMSE